MSNDEGIHHRACVEMKSLYPFDGSDVTSCGGVVEGSVCQNTAFFHSENNNEKEHLYQQFH